MFVLPHQRRRIRGIQGGGQERHQTVVKRWLATLLGPKPVMPRALYRQTVAVREVFGVEEMLNLVRGLEDRRGNTVEGTQQHEGDQDQRYAQTWTGDFTPLPVHGMPPDDAGQWCPIQTGVTGSAQHPPGAFAALDRASPE